MCTDGESRFKHQINYNFNSAITNFVQLTIFDSRFVLESCFFEENRFCEILLKRLFSDFFKLGFTRGNVKVGLERYYRNVIVQLCYIKSITAILSQLLNFLPYLDTYLQIEFYNNFISLITALESCFDRQLKIKS